MPNSSRMIWGYPAEFQDPWYAAFSSMVTAVDASAYASREDRQIILAKGGLFTWDAGTGILSWDAALEMVSPITGFRADLSIGNVTLLDGQTFYVNLTRGMQSNIVIPTGSVADTVPNTDDAFAIGFRRGTEVYFRTGQIIRDGETRGIFSASFGVPGTTLVTDISTSGRDSHNSNAYKVIGAISIDPTTYQITGAVSTFYFKAVAANGLAGKNNHIDLYNLTDADTICTLDFISTNTAKDVAILTVGAGAGLLPAAEKIYEIRAYLGAASTGIADTIEVYSSGIYVLSLLV